MIPVPPNIRGQVEEEYTVIEGQTVLLPCYVEGTPTPEVSWRRNFIPFTSDSERYVFSNEGVTISPAMVSDKAIYECVATNVAGDASKVITLIVHSKFNQTLLGLKNVFPVTRLTLLKKIQNLFMGIG